MPCSSYAAHKTLTLCRLLLLSAFRPALLHRIGDALATFGAQIALRLSCTCAALRATWSGASRACRSSKQRARLLQLEDLRVDLGDYATNFHEEPPECLGCLFISELK